MVTSASVGRRLWSPVIFQYADDAVEGVVALGGVPNWVGASANRAEVEALRGVLCPWFVVGDFDEGLDRVGTQPGLPACLGAPGRRRRPGVGLGTKSRELVLPISLAVLVKARRVAGRPAAASSSALEASGALMRMD